MSTRPLAVAAFLALTASLAAGPLCAVPTNNAHHAKKGYIELTPEKLRWFRHPDVPLAQFAYLSGSPGKKGPYTFRVKLEPGAILPPHYHPADESGTVLSGTFFTGMGNRFVKKLGRPLPAGSYAFIPKGMRHFAWIEKPTIVQVHGNGPWKLIPVDVNGKPSGKIITLPVHPPKPTKK